MMPDEPLNGASIMIVDDQQSNVTLLEALLSERGYVNLTSTTDSRRALSLFLEQQPDLCSIFWSGPLRCSGMAHL